MTVVVMVSEAEASRQCVEILRLHSVPLRMTKRTVMLSGGVSHSRRTPKGSVNDLITPGGTLKIKGGKLKIAGDDPQIGVWFESETGEAELVAPRDLIVNNPSDLIVQIPPLAAGRYQLAIRSQFSGATLLKEPRTAVFDRILTVQ
jgi:hypothetical protein